MRVFASNDFRGHNPVGASAVVVAPDMEVARAMLSEELEKVGLRLEPTDIVKEIDLTTPSVWVLQDGEY